MNPHELHSALSEELVAEIECSAASAGRFACSLPLAYPDGDGVVVWIDDQGNHHFEVSDLGEGYTSVFARFTPDPKAFAPLAQGICQSMGLAFVDGRIVGTSSPTDLPTVVWAVGQASARVAEAITFHRLRQRRAQPSEVERGFVTEVEQELRGRSVDLARGVPLIGASGHRHQVTIFVPSHEALVEPIEPRAGFNGASPAYVKFGDIASVNGYARYSIIDDREDPPSEEIVRLLFQVSQVVRWSDREPWLSRVASVA